MRGWDENYSKMDASGLSCHGNNICSRKYSIPNAYILEYSIAPIFFSFSPVLHDCSHLAFHTHKKYHQVKKKAQRWTEFKKLPTLTSNAD